MVEKKKVITKVLHLENVIYSAHYKIKTATLWKYNRFIVLVDNLLEISNKLLTARDFLDTHDLITIILKEQPYIDSLCVNKVDEINKKLIGHWILNLIFL